MQKEEELVIMREQIIDLQLELKQQHNVLTAEKAEKQKMICIYELAIGSQQETIGELQADITMYETDARKLTQQVKDQSNDPR